MTYDNDRRFRDSSDSRDEFRGSRRDRKARVLHTRISEELAEDIRRVAEGLRVPVSNLVRNVLEEAVNVVEAVSDDVGDVFEDVIGEAEAARDRIRDRFTQRRRQARQHSRTRRSGASPTDQDVEAELRSDEAAEARTTAPDRATDAPFEEPGRGISLDDVIGWQPLVLHRSQPCAQCSRLLKRGEDAFAAVNAGGITQVLVCPTWVREGRCAN